MSSIPASLLEALVQAWKALTGGALSVVVGDQVPEGPVPLRSLPRAVRQALQDHSDLAGLSVRGRVWWVTTPILTSAVRVQIAAWAPNHGAWKPALQLWSDLLTGFLEQKQIAEGLTEELINAWDRLTFLYELAQIVGGPSETDEMLAAIVRLLSQVVSAEDVLLVTSAKGHLAAFTASNARLPKPEALVASVAGASRPLGLDELRPALLQADSPLAEVGDLLVAPLAGGGGAGAIGLVNPHGQRFDANDVQLLASVAEQVSALLEAAQSRAALLQSQRLEHELAIAAELQASLLPVSLPSIRGFELAARLLPARRVGGDFYDAVGADGEVMLLLADVAGKGMPAAMLTAVVHATFMSEAAHSQDPAGVLQAMNRLIYQDLDRTGTFVTAIAARLEPDPRGFTYASAGHVDLAVWRAEPGTVELLPATGLPLGLEPRSAYVSRRSSLAPGDVLVLYSDGVTEAEGPDGAMFGVDGLADMLWAAHPARAEAQIQAIVNGLDVHRGDLPLRDDIALLLIRVLSGEEEASVTPFVIPAQLGAVGRVVELSRGVCHGVEAATGTTGRHFADEFALAVSEIVTNQVQHAYGGRNGRIQGRLSRYPDRVQADLSDAGVLFERPDLVGPKVSPEDPPDRGYGLRIARALLDRCEYRRLPGGRNHWCLVKRAEGALTHED